MSKTYIPSTVNLHSLIPCNFSCGYCYAGFKSCDRARIPGSELRAIIRQIADAHKEPGSQPRKVTFAGGEPLLSGTVIEDIKYAKSLALVTSLVTNGWLLDEKRLRALGEGLDWLTISIDSLSNSTNQKIGRSFRGKTISAEEYLHKIQLARDLGIRVKINTVLNQKNIKEDFTWFISKARPRRWKILQASRIESENCSGFSNWVVSSEEFHDFVSRNRNGIGTEVVVVPETQDAIYGSYAMVAPNGCFFSNMDGVYRYSRPIVDVGIESAFSDVDFSLGRFVQRQGDYDFATGLNRKAVS